MTSKSIDSARPDHDKECSWSNGSRDTVDCCSLEHCSHLVSYHEFLANGDDGDAYFNEVDRLCRSIHGRAAVDLIEDDGDAIIHILQRSFSNSESPCIALKQVEQFASL